MTAWNRNCVLHMRTDVRILAALHKHFASQGVVTRSRGELGALLFEQVYNAITEDGGAVPMTTEEARRYLLKYGLSRFEGSESRKTGRLIPDAIVSRALHHEEKELSSYMDAAKEAFRQLREEGFTTGGAEDASDADDVDNERGV